MAEIWIYHAESDSLFIDDEEFLYSGKSYDAGLCTMVGPAVTKSVDEVTTLLRALEGWTEDDVTACIRSYTMTQTPPAPRKITADQVVEAYVKTRDQLDAMKKEFDKQCEALKATQEKREAWLMSELNKIGAESIRTNHGTVFVDWKDSATVADAAEFMSWVHEDWDERRQFLENRVSKTAVKARLDDGQTEPPGVKYTKIKDVKVRRK